MPRKIETPVPVYRELVDTSLIQDAEPEDWGFWGPTVQLMRRLGAKSIQSLGAGIGVTFEQFSTETQVYPTRAVVAMSATTHFNLGDAVNEPRVFSLQLSNKPWTGGWAPSGAIDMGFAPIPDRPSGVDGVELARRYVVLLTGLLEKQPKLFDGHLKAALLGEK